MNKNLVWGVVAVIVVAVLAVLLMRDPVAPETTGPNATSTPDTSAQGTGTQGGATVSVGGSVSVGSVKEFTVTGSNFAFAPKTMTVKKGDRVKITFVNSAGTHDLKIDEFGVATPVLQAGGTATVEFVADKAGSFEYYCSVGTHRAMGMKGTLTVTP